EPLERRPVALEAHAATLAAAPGRLIERLRTSLADDLPLLSRDGGFVATGCHAELDEARHLRDETRQVIAGLQSNYAALTGVKNLKVRHNNVLGYFIEVTAQQAPALQAPEHAAMFIHR